MFRFNKNKLAKKYFYEEYPSAKKNWYKEVIENFLLKTKDISENDRKDCEKIIKKLSKTKFYFSNDHRFEMILSRLEKYLKGNNRKELQKIFIGRTNKRLLDAYASQERNGAKYIAISLGFSNIIDIIPNHFAIFNYLSRNLVSDASIKKYLEEDLENGILKMSYYIENNFDENYYEKELIYLEWNYFRLPELKKIIDEEAFLYYSAIYYFVMLHEVGHHLIGHTNKQRNSDFELLPKYVERIENLQNVSRKHKDELQADSFATAILLDMCIDKYLYLPPPLIICSIVLSFIGFSLIHGDITKSTERHPSFITRIENFLGIMKDKLGNEDVKLAINNIDNYLEFMSSKYDVQLSELKKALR